MTADTYLVTGGAGFIGSNILARLAADPAKRVVISDRLRHADDGKWLNIAKHPIFDIVAPENVVEWLRANVRSISGVIHMGAISATTETDVDRIIENNFHLSKALWDVCTAHQKPFIYASSAATYGDGAFGFDDDNAFEATLRLRPLNAYGFSKRLFDLYALRQAGSGHAPPQWAGLRFFNVYGPNEYHKGRMRSVVHQVFPKALAGETMRLFKSHNPDYADGGQLRDFVYVEDCARIVEWLLASKTQAGIINVGTGKARSFADLAGAVYAALGRPATIDFDPMPEDLRGRYQYFTEAKMGRLKTLGYPGTMTELEAGIGDYVSSYLNTPDRYR
jgi:ADP-L-glycero-D-manno-heptose 6-epimerase